MRFGILLLDDGTGSRVNSLVHKHQSDAEQINSEILQQWIAGKGKHPVTWKTLVEVLCDINNALAVEIEAVIELPDEEIGKCRSTSTITSAFCTRFTLQKGFVISTIIFFTRVATVDMFLWEDTRIVPCDSQLWAIQCT